MNKNLENMIECPRFNSCSIPKCPLDEDMKFRVELKDDPQCPLRRITENIRKKRVEGRITPKMRSLLISPRERKQKCP